MSKREPTLRQQLARWLVALASLLLLTPMAGAEVSETVQRSFDLASGATVTLENLAGSVQVTGGAAQVTLEAIIHGESRELVDQIELEIHQQSGKVAIHARYPVEDHSKYCYPAMSGASRTSTRYQGEKVTVTGRPSGAVTLWVDFVLHLPNGVGIELKNAVGDVSMSSVTGSSKVDTGSGNVVASDGAGPLSIDTGSGNVALSSHHGNIDADTGSGNIKVSGAVGMLRADTGSGNIALEDVEGGTVDADTGSGNIVLGQVRGEIRADTGSGSVVGHELVAVGRLEADTGSGSVQLEGDFQGTTRIAVDTGSGSVELRGAFPGLELEIDTGSGSIEVDLPGLSVRTRERDQLRATSGDGRVPLKIDSGSGSVTIAGS